MDCLELAGCGFVFLLMPMPRLNIYGQAYEWAAFAFLFWHFIPGMA